MKDLKAVFLISTLTFSNVIFSAQSDTSEVIAKNTPQLVGLDCVKDYESLLPLLGRGAEYPEFLVADIKNALLKQSSTSVLMKIECTSKADVKTGVLLGENENQRVLSSLELTFPLTVNVKNGDSTYQLDVAQHYKAENLETTDKREASQVFEVKSQQVLP